LRELGYGVAIKSLRVVAVPANTPVSHIQVLTQALEAATTDPRFVDITVNRIRQPVFFRQGDELRAIIQREADEFARLQANVNTR